MEERNWYLVNTQSGKEKVAATRLNRFKLETLCPEILSLRSNGYGKKYERAHPLFPGYLFTRCSLKEYGLAALGMPKQLLRFVGFGLGPVVVDDFLVDEIKSRIGVDGYVILDDQPAVRRAHCGFKLDQPVRITGGSFTGFTAVFKREIEGAARVVLLMELMNARREVQFPVEYVEALTFAEME